MASVKQYALSLWDVQATVAQKLGTDIRSASIQLRAALLAVDVTVAFVLKLLVDNRGVVTDAQLGAAADQIKNASFPPLSTDVTPTGDDSTLPPPDLG